MCASDCRRLSLSCSCARGDVRAGVLLVDEAIAPSDWFASALGVEDQGRKA